MGCDGRPRAKKWRPGSLDAPGLRYNYRHWTRREARLSGEGGPAAQQPQHFFHFPVELERCQ